MAAEHVNDVVRAIDRERARLRRLLRSQTSTALAKRPPSGEWSIIENVRHLLFAEQLHLGRFLHGGFVWSPLGLTNRTGRAYVNVGARPTNNVDRVFEAWDDVHRSVRKAVRSADDDVQAALEGNLRHLTFHIRTIENLLPARNA
ncbi:MAG: DinB family protein [Chloroflexi bacterium]|nr:DinB family protein [Chloroflexota bacterium]